MLHKKVLELVVTERMSQGEKVKNPKDIAVEEDTEEMNR